MTLTINGEERAFGALSNVAALVAELQTIRQLQHQAVTWQAVTHG